MIERNQLLWSCNCSLDTHWEMLNQLTVVVFTRDRAREVSRLLRSLAGYPCSVDVWDNGEVQLARELQALTDKQSYRYRKGPWAQSLRSAASHVRTDFVCLVDDDGLLQPYGAAMAMCALRRNSQSVAAEGQSANFVVRDGRAILLKGTESPAASGLQIDRLTRWSAFLQAYSEAPWYAVHRSSSFADTFRFAADVEELSTSRNVSTPLFIGMTSTLGTIIKSPALVSLREDSLPPHNQQAMDIWIGDWLADSQYRDEVDAVLALTRQSLTKAGMSRSDGEEAIRVFCEAMERHAHVEPVVRKSYLAAFGRLSRPLRSRIGAARTSRPGEKDLQPLDGRPSLSMSALNAMTHPTLLEVGPIRWDSRDAHQTFLALGVDEAMVVDRPRELRSQAYLHSLQTGVRTES